MPFLARCPYCDGRLAVVRAESIKDERDEFIKEIPYPKTSLLSQELRDMEFPTRCTTVFAKNDIIYLGDLVQMTEKELRHLTNFGIRSLLEVKTILDRLGLHLSMTITKESDSGQKELQPES